MRQSIGREILSGVDTNYFGISLSDSELSGQCKNILSKSRAYLSKSGLERRPWRVLFTASLNHYNGPKNSNFEYSNAKLGRINARASRLKDAKRVKQLLY